MIMPVSEGSCNMTMEGEYCPEHGLMECGSMEEDGGAVGMPYSMGEEMDEAMFPGSAIGDKLRAAKDSIGRGAGEALKGAMIAAPGAGAGASAGAAMSAGAGSALFAPALGAGALGGAAAALGGFLTYKGLNWLAQKLFGTKEEALQFANAHLKAASSGQPQFEFQGKTYPVKIKSPQEAQQLLGKVRDLQSQLGEGDNLATFESTLDTMRKAAGVPILKAALLSAGGSLFDKFTESRLMDSAGETLQHILIFDLKDFTRRLLTKLMSIGAKTLTLWWLLQNLLRQFCFLPFQACLQLTWLKQVEHH
jgi:hypothetical protein